MELQSRDRESSNSSPAKDGTKYYENYTTTTNEYSSTNPELNAAMAAVAAMDPAERQAREKKLVRKLDWQLIPWLCLLYLTSFLDRTNIGNAKVNGLVKDLHMTNGQYNAALSLFFVTYALFEPLTNILLKKWRPRVFLTLTIVVWGIVMVTMGLVHNFAGLATARTFLGVAEAGLFPVSSESDNIAVESAVS